MKAQLYCFLIIILSISLPAQGQIPELNQLTFKLYPEVLASKPNLPSPFIFDGREYVLAVTKEDRYALIEVTPSNDRGICKQLVVDSADFTELHATGLHSIEELSQVQKITGWSVDTISLLGQPGGLSNGGFMAAGEDVLSVISGDNQIVKRIGLTHPTMAKPLFHVLNMMDADLSLNRWNMARHEWENIPYFYYNGQKVNVMAYDTKGGQKSIFNDDLGGVFHIKLWRDPKTTEMEYLKKHYEHLPDAEFKKMVELLTFMNIGEMQPQYIMRYGFYEGHTVWRAEPIAIAFIFGMIPLNEIDDKLGHDLFGSLTHQFNQ